METSKVIDKIRKLLSLAGQKDSANEAAAAFAQAQKLATEHRIELACVQLSAETSETQPDPMATETIKAGTGSRVAGWRKALLWGMEKSLGVYCVFSQGIGEFTFAGRKSDIQTAIYLYRAICAEIERLAHEQARGHGAAYANAFKLGAASTVTARLQAQYAESLQDARSSGVSSTAIACVAQAHGVAERWYTRDHKVRTTSGAAACSSRDGLAAGREAGKSIDLGGSRDALGRGNRALRA